MSCTVPGCLRWSHVPEWSCLGIWKNSFHLAFMVKEYQPLVAIRRISLAPTWNMKYAKHIARILRAENWGAREADITRVASWGWQVKKLIICLNWGKLTELAEMIVRGLPHEADGITL